MQAVSWICILQLQLQFINSVITNFDGNSRHLRAQPCAHLPESLLAVHRRRGGRAAAGYEDGTGPAQHGADARARQTAQRARDHMSTAGEDIRQGHAARHQRPFVHPDLEICYRGPAIFASHWQWMGAPGIVKLASAS